MNLYIDFETKSRCDLKKAGAYRYAEDPSTEIMCMAYAVDDKPVQLLTKDSSTDEWNTFFKIAAKADAFFSHNCGFERAIWREKLPCPLPDLTKWRCSAAQAAACCLPRSLGEACDAIGTPCKKDVSARTLMLKLSKPNSKGEFVGTPEEFQRLYEYCKADVEAERALSKALPALSDGELAIWRLDQKINDRGLPMDAPFLREVLALLDEIDKDRLARIHDMTGGMVESPRKVAVLRGWLQTQGCHLPDLSAGTVRDYLVKGAVSAKVEKVLWLRQELAKSSTAKYSAALECIGKDGRVRGTLLYYGANTGRWSGRLIQPQNLPRCKLSAEALDEKIFDLFAGLDPEPMTTASVALRSAISSPEGLTWGDLDQIEARTLPWLAGENSVLEDFRNGRDVYVTAAAEIYAKDAKTISKDSEERQVGKVAVLALGFGGGIGAFGSMAKGVYNVDLEGMCGPVLARATPDQIEKAKIRAIDYIKRVANPLPMHQAIACDLVKQFWRKSRPETVKFWYALEEAAVKAVQNPGTTYRVGVLKLGMIRDWMVIVIPSGRKLYYFQPRVDSDGKFSCMRNCTEGWQRREMHGGVFAENVTQAVSRDVICESLIGLEALGVPVVLTVHDEIVVEGSYAKAMKHVMGKQIAWAKGLPIAAKIGEGRRYGK